MLFEVENSIKQITKKNKAIWTNDKTLKTVKRKQKSCNTHMKTILHIDFNINDRKMQYVNVDKQGKNLKRISEKQTLSHFTSI